jgi:peptide/nickel transport system permease protein
VGEAFWNYLPVTLEMNLLAAPIVIIFGIWLGTLAGIHRDTWIDHTTRIFAIVGWSLPTFLFALVLLMIFYGYLQVFSPGVLSDQMTMLILDSPEQFTRFTGMYTLDGILNGRLDVFFDALAHLVLPVSTYVIVVVALNMRVMRSGMIEELSWRFQWKAALPWRSFIIATVSAGGWPNRRCSSICRCCCASACLWGWCLLSPI